MELNNAELISLVLSGDNVIVGPIHIQKLFDYLPSNLKLINIKIQKEFEENDPDFLPKTIDTSGTMPVWHWRQTNLLNIDVYFKNVNGNIYIEYFNYHDIIRDELILRNGRWGTCFDCKRLGGIIYPELCRNTNRADHNLPLPEKGIIFCGSLPPHLSA